MGYVLARVEEIGAELQALPKLESNAREVNKQHAVRVLARAIFGLQKNGYTLQAIARLLSERGIDISASTLGNYLRRLKERQRRTRSEQQRTGSTSGGAASQGTNGTAPPPGTPRDLAPSTLTKARFAVREDAEDI